jgi:hypothetical protein
MTMAGASARAIAVSALALLAALLGVAAAANALIKFLRTPAAAQIFKARGLEPS